MELEVHTEMTSLGRRPRIYHWLMFESVSSCFEFELDTDRWPRCNDDTTRVRTFHHCGRVCPLQKTRSASTARIEAMTSGLRFMSSSSDRF